MLGVILTENSFQFNEINISKPMVSQWAQKQQCLSKTNNTKPREWKCYIDDLFSLQDCKRNQVEHFIKQANTFHPTIKYTAKISENEITFLDTVVFKGERFIKESILDIKTHYKPTETFQYTLFTLCHPPGVKKRLYKFNLIKFQIYNKKSFNRSI